MASDRPPLAGKLEEEFGRIDIYLFDQMQRGRIKRGMRVLDAGCGSGRNVHYLLREGFSVDGIDRNPQAVERARRLAAEMGIAEAAQRFRVGDITEMPYDDDAFEVVLSSAVLHFATDETEFGHMVSEMWRVLAPGGILWARLASSIGIESQVTPLGHRRHLLPDGSERFLVDEDFLISWTQRLGGALKDPLKTTIVQGLRCMTTWVVGR